MKLTICVITYQRPEGLRRLMEGLRALDLDVEPPLELDALVVDNDPEGSARAIVDEVSPSLPFAVAYVIEELPGIPSARNRALEETRQQDVVMFIDDDEVPDRHWIGNLLRTKALVKSELVAGPVLPVFPDQAPQWLQGSGFYDPLRYEMGTDVLFAGTGNMLMDRQAIEEKALRFDPRLSLTGGSDSLFCMEARHAGLRIGWADDAVVYEWIDTERMTLRRLLHRAFRYGNILVLCERLARVTPGARAYRLASGLMRLARGLVFVVLGGITLDRGRSVRGLWRAADGIGVIAGFLRIRARDYGR